MSNNKYLSDDDLKIDINKIKEEYGNVLMGNVSTLKTEAKTFVGAINELYNLIDELSSSVLTGLNISGDNTVYAANSTYTCTPIPPKATYTGVNWSIASGSAATISSSGLLTIKNTAWSDTVTIKATSKDDSSITSTKSVTVSYPMTVSITGEATINGEGQYALSITPTKASSVSFVWSIISGGDYASIDQTGKVSVVEGTENKSVTIKATSEYGEATKTITVSNIEASETLLFSTTSIESKSYTSALMSQNGGLREWTLLFSANCSSVSSTAIWIDDGISSGNVPQNVTGGIALVNYAWGAAKFSFYLGGTWVEGSQWNSGNNNNIKYAITRSGNTVKYSSDGSTWKTVSVSKWNTSNSAFTTGSKNGGSNAVASGGQLTVELYDTSEISSATLSNFFK